MSLILEVKDLQTKFYTQDGVVNAVNGVSYQLNESETLAIVGESGCGKSVSVLSIMGLIPDPPGKVVKGEVIFEGQDILKLPKDKMRKIRGKDIAMVFQDPMTSLNPVYSIGFQIEEALKLHLGMSSESARKRSVELLDMVGIPKAHERIKDFPYQFSGGMRQRAMIAMALSCNPKILIADEPTTALDVTIQAQIVDLVKQLKNDLGMAVVWITHDLGVVAGLAEKIIVMYAGYIIEKGIVEDVYENPAHPYTAGLLRSLPRLDSKTRDQLKPIEGFPPDLIDFPEGCPFYARCHSREEQCYKLNPSLIGVTANHEAACWLISPR